MKIYLPVKDYTMDGLKKSCYKQAHKTDHYQYPVFLIFSWVALSIWGRNGESTL